MRTPLRSMAFGVALTGTLVLSGFSTRTQAAAPPEKSFPDSAAFYFKAKDVAGLREAFLQSQYGQLLQDPAFKPFKDDVVTRLEERGNALKSIIGMSVPELLEIPQGPIALAVLPKDDAGNPAVIVLTVEAGKNDAKLAEVLEKAGKHSEESEEMKVTKEEFKGVTLHIITPPVDKDAKEGDHPDPPLIWAKEGTLFYIGTDADSLKDLIGKSTGREDCIGNSPKYAAATKKLGADNQVFWFSDFANLLKIIKKTGAQGKNAANVEQFEAMIPVFGINGLKGATGSYNMNAGPFDGVSKTFVMMPAPLNGLLKVIALPKVSLKPESWVPATVASYQTFSWDLDASFAAINDLANMFQPGVMNIIEQQLVGANGGEPLNFKKDIFDPLGDRVSIVTDYKKPIKEDSQRVLVAVALEDPKTFEATLQKLIGLAGGDPKKREFSGVTIYEFETPNMPDGAVGGNVQFKGPISVTLFKDTLLVSTEPTLLEQTIRGGGPALADSEPFLAVAKEVPNKISSMTYVRPDESARLTYDMLKGGQFEKALQGAAVAGGPDVSKIGKLFDKEKLPDFSVFAKYLSQGGGFSVLEDDGLSITNFTVRKANP